MKFVDAVGTEHGAHDTRHAARIVSLVPSITELLCDLGLAHNLVGRTGFCIHPAAQVADIPKVGGTKDVNIEKIRGLAPTHLIVNIDENEKPTVELLARFVPKLIVTHPVAPRDNLSLYRMLGGIFGADAQAERLCLAFEQEYQGLPKPKTSKRVLYCIWREPWMTVSRTTYIAAMLELIGWRQWIADAVSGEEQRYPKFSWDAALLDSIDVVLLSSEPYRFTETHALELRTQIGKPVKLVDGEMLSWYGSRAIQGLRYLRELALESNF